MVRMPSKARKPASRPKPRPVAPRDCHNDPELPKPGNTANPDPKKGHAAPTEESEAIK